jgi:nucleotide-binding universal stress UspA family protein
MAFDVDVVLVPLDGSPQSDRALEYAVALADRYEASLHALYVRAGGPDREPFDEAAVAERHERLMEAVTAMAGAVPVTHSSAVGFSQSSLRQHPGSVVLDAAEDVDADFIVVPRETSVGDSEAVLDRSGQYVVEYASQPVLAV